MPSSTAYAEALALLSGAGTWHELRRSLQDRGLDVTLSAGEKQDLLDAWTHRAARELDDWALSQELKFWANGGTFADHLEGWQAVPPAILLEEAKARGWFVQQLPSGVVVNPPEGKPVIVKLAGFAGSHTP